MLRRLFTLFALLSLLLCIVTSAVWIWSYFVVYEVRYARRCDNALDVDGGRVDGYDYLAYAGGGYGFYGRYPAYLETDGWSAWPTKMSDCQHGPWGSPPFTFEADFVKFPLWTVAGFLAIAPAIGLTKQLRRRRLIQSGGCPTCGYDLRASPERCPECGTATI